MPTDNYYQILQVDPSATQDEIRAAYRRLAREYHPDVNTSPEAADKIREINEAYAVLGDPARRRQYDQQLKRQQNRQEQDPGPHQQRDPGPGVPVVPPYACDVCGAINSTLRTAAFPYIIGAVFFSLDRMWGGVYCKRCRTNEMFKAKFLTLLLGWWSFPLGVFLTIENLCRNSQGYILAEPNAKLLRELGAFFFYIGRVEEAKAAFAASYHYVADAGVRTIYQSFFGSEPPLPDNDDEGRFSGRLFGATVVALLAVAVLYGFGVFEPEDEIYYGVVPFVPGNHAGAVIEQAAFSLLATPIPPTTKSTSPLPTPSANTVTSPLATPSASSTAGQRPRGMSPTEVALALQRNRTPTPVSLRQPRSSALEGPPFVLTPVAGFDWLGHGFLPPLYSWSLPRKYQYLYPNGWWDDISGDPAMISISNEDTRLDVFWYVAATDLAWFFAEDSADAADKRRISAAADAVLLKSLESLGTLWHVSQFEQASIGRFPVFSQKVHVLDLRGDWGDAESVQVAGAVVLCGPRRICEFVLRKIDASITFDDWRKVGAFADHLVFLDDEPLPSEVAESEP